jgi:hypothetical protein
MASPDQGGDFLAVFPSISPSVVVSCIVAYYLLNAICSVTLHPFAALAGPKVCAITRIPYWLAHMRGKDVH